MMPQCNRMLKYTTITFNNIQPLHTNNYAAEASRNSLQPLQLIKYHELGYVQAFIHIVIIWTTILTHIFHPYIYK
jgi:hypothetical protein